MENIIIVLILLAILSAAGFYIYSKKKKGAKCIGCPDGATCGQHCSGCSGNCCGNNKS